jgi:hypothetical protein
MCVHRSPAESVTEVMWLVAPLYSLADRTNRSPAVVGVGNAAVSVVAAAVSVPLAIWTSCGVADAAFTVREYPVVWVALTPVPVTVMARVDDGVDTDVVTVITEVCPEVMTWGLNDTRVPVGAPVALRATDWAAPLVTAVVMVLVAGAPAVTVAELGAAEMEKSSAAGAFTVRENPVVWVVLVPVPVTVMGVVATGVDTDVVTVMTEVCPAVMTWGLNDTRAPVGAPVAVRATDWATPLVTAVVMVLVAGEPAVTVAELGEAEMEKVLGGGVDGGVVTWFDVPGDERLPDPSTAVTV